CSSDLGADGRGAGRAVQRDARDAVAAAGLDRARRPVAAGLDRGQVAVDDDGRERAGPQDVDFARHVAARNTRSGTASNRPAENSSAPVFEPQLVEVVSGIEQALPL